jgi:hypothetical protein
MTLTEQVKALRVGQRVRAEFTEGNDQWTAEGALRGSGSAWLAVGNSQTVRTNDDKPSACLTAITILVDPLPTEVGVVIEATVTRGGVSVDNVRLMRCDGSSHPWCSAAAVDGWRHWHNDRALSNVRVLLAGEPS